METVDIHPEVFADLVRLPEIAPWFTEGDSDFELTDVPGSVYLASHEPGTILFICAQPINSVAFHLHVAAHPKHRGNVVIAARAAYARLREIVCRTATLFSLIPSDNEPAVALARLLGFSHCGTLHGAHQRRMERHDMLIYEA
jgi:hypothetical protein